MGTKTQFPCKHCSYQAIVSGGDDVGMRCCTTTISCQDCGELFDVITSEQPWDESTELSDGELVCPGPATDDTEDEDDENTDRSNPDHRVQRWTFPGPRPKCGRGMTKGDAVMMCD